MNDPVDPQDESQEKSVNQDEKRDERPTDEIPVYKPSSPAPKTIQQATSFDEPGGLFDILLGMGTIPGTPHPETGEVVMYTAEELIETITKMRSGDGGKVTRAGGLRKKVNELLDLEQNQ